MALQGFLSADDAAVKFDFPQAYAKVAVVTVVDDWDILVNFFADASARAQNAAPVLQMKFQTAPLPGDFKPAIYGFLKTQPIFAGWVDA